MAHETDFRSVHSLSSAREIDTLDLLAVLVSRWRLLLVAPILAGAAAIGLTFLIKPTFTARTTFLPPQQQQNAAASALATLGALSDLGGGLVKTPGDQYVSLMQSATLEDRIVERFKLMQVYDTRYRFQARRKLEEHVRIALGKKDGLIVLEADADNPKLAADMANQYVEELRNLTNTLALTEAQGRRIFFETELNRTKTRLAQAQIELQRSGFNGKALKTAPEAEAENYARLKAQAIAAEVQLQALRRGLADTAPEVQRQLAQLAALRGQIAQLDIADGAQNSSDYVSRYREFKYQETLFDLLSKQYELARLDESRDGRLIQVIDRAAVPEYKSAPKRVVIGIVALVSTWIVLALVLILRGLLRVVAADPVRGPKLDRLGQAWRRSP
jgi:uncharacterized protein involved in exopolysaccharide biosynthesis